MSWQDVESSNRLKKATTIFGNAKKMSDLLNYVCVQTVLNDVFDLVQHITCENANMTIDGDNVLLINEFFVLDKIHFLAPCYIIDKAQIKELMDGSIESLESTVGFCYSDNGKLEWTIIAKDNNDQYTNDDMNSEDDDDDDDDDIFA